MGSMGPTMAVVLGSVGMLLLYSFTCTKTGQF